ncbi:MAG: hypothetical protein NC338_04140 [Firmicutes bacterium]|nr:hypothetical protein [Bacillota bacterium]MCM1402117.1 hypothetical protein [Bacteroides sp.]
MADNYLEKRMEDYLRGTPAGKNSYKISRNVFREPMPQRHVIMMGQVNDLAKSIMVKLSGCGCKVAFTSSNDTTPSKLAQETGALFVPGSNVDRMLEVAKSRWGTIDFIIAIETKAQSALAQLNESIPVITVTATEDEIPRSNEVLINAQPERAAEVARLCAFLMLPGGEHFLGQTITIK